MLDAFNDTMLPCIYIYLVKLVDTSLLVVKLMILKITMLGSLLRQHFVLLTSTGPTFKNILLYFLLYLISVVLINFPLAIVGDITPTDGVPKLEKSRREREALDYMCKLLGGGSRGI